MPSATTPRSPVNPEKLEHLHAASLRLLGLLVTPQAEESLLKQGLESLTALIGARYGAIGLLDEHGKLKQFLHSGISPEVATRIGRLPEGRGLLGVVIRENHALRVDDMARDLRAVGFPPNHPLMKSLLAVPVSHAQQIYGRVYLSEKTNGQPFTDEDEQLVTHFAKALALTLYFHRAEAERLRAQAILQQVANTVSSVVGDAFFRTLVIDFAKAMNTNYAFIGEFAPGGHDAIQTVAVNAKGQLVENFTYHLKDTPCINVVGKAPCQYPRNIQQQFPDDHLLRDMGIESYVGCPLFGAAGQPLGLFVVMDGKPMHDPSLIQALMQICAARAAAELERRQSEVALRKLSSAIEQTADSVLITDAEGVIQYVNPGYEQATGYTRAEAVGKKPNIVKSGKHGEGFYRTLWQTIHAGKVFRGTLVNRHKNGDLYYEEKTITPLKNEQGRITHFVSTGKDITERVRAEQALRAGAVQLADAQRMARLGNWELDLVGNVLTWSDEIYRIFEIDRAQFGASYEALLDATHPDDRAMVNRAYTDSVANKTPYDIEHRLLMKDGRVKHVHERCETFYGNGGKPLRSVGTVQDVTERKQAEDKLARLGRILDDSSNEIYVFCAQSLRFVQVNQGAQRNLGYNMEELKGLTPLDLKPEFTQESFAALIAPLRQGEKERINFTTVHRRKDGSDYPVDVQLQFMRHETPPVFVAIIQDITERRQAEERLSHLAYYDVLTDLPNRVLLLERLQQAMVDAERVNRLVAVMFLDLDRFKIINDSLGHHVGDALLKAVAERLKSCVRPGDIVARLGGDEFTVVLANVAHMDDVARVARKLLASFEQPFRVDGKELFTTTSIGITLYPFDEQAPEGLLKNADAAMYHAKESGRNVFQFFTAELNVRAERRLQIETALRTALEREELSLHYQPQVDTKNGRLIGMEALLRWQNPELGNVSPVEFIPIAEETGLILPIGDWVLRAACHQIKAWHATKFSFSKMQVAVNISGKQLRQKNFPDRVRGVLLEAALEPRYLDLELTESLLMVDAEETGDIMHTLHDMGVSFSVDDFGTGYSSLSYLKRFPIDILKIDQSFVRDIASDPNDVAIVRTIIAMAHTLGMRVIAEGVETYEQLAFLRDQDCDGSQGYYCSRPLAANDFTELLADWERIRQGRCRADTAKKRRRAKPRTGRPWPAALASVPSAKPRKARRKLKK